MKTRLKISETLLMLLLALSLVTVAATAQTTSPAAKKKTTQTNKPPAAPPKPDLEPKAIELLKAVSSRLGAAHTVSFTAVQIFESPSRQGPPLAYAKKTDVTLERPDKMRVIISGDGPGSEFYYNGKTMMAFAPAENLLAVSDAPPTIDAMLEAVYHSAGIFFTFTDLVVADPYKDMAEGLTLPITSANPMWSSERRRTWWHTSTPVCSFRCGLEPRTSSPRWSGQFFSTIRRVCAARWSSPTGSSTFLSPRMPSRSRTPPTRNAYRSLKLRRRPRRAPCPLLNHERGGTHQ